MPVPHTCRYQHGAAYEVYPMVLSHAFEGLRFDLAAVALYVPLPLLPMPLLSPCTRG